MSILYDNVLILKSIYTKSTEWMQISNIMLAEGQIYDFLVESYTNEIMRQAKEAEDTLSLEIHLKLDLTKTIKNKNPLGIYIIGNYSQFLQISEQNILKILQFNSLRIPEFGVSVRFHLTSCPLPRHNIQNSQFMNVSLRHPEGVLVYLRQAYILGIGQPQIYLHQWVETWQALCGCKVPKIQKNFKQSLIEIIKNKYVNLKKARYTQPPKCPQCSSKLISTGINQQIYLNCQKIKLHVNMKEKDGFNQEEIFQDGIIQIYADQFSMNMFKQYGIVNLCVFYVAHNVITKYTQFVNLKTQTSIYAISVYPNKGQTSANNVFFGSLRNIQLKSKFCESFSDFDTILENYQNLLSAVNKIKFPYLSLDSFTALKLCVLNSLFGHHRQQRVHLLLFTDEITIVQKCLQLHYLKICKFPTLYDHQTLTNFFLTCNHSIILVVNPSKKDIQYVNDLVDGKIMSDLNITLWVVIQPNSGLKKDIHVDLFQLVLDLSFQNNFNVCSDVYEELIDKKLSCFMNDIQDQIILTIPRVQNRKNLINDHFSEPQKQEMDLESEREHQEQLAKDILKNYYLKSRDYKKINTNTITHVKTVAEGFAYFRFFVNYGPNSKIKIRISILDAVIAIFLDEQASRHRYSSSNTLFCNQISKLILNEGDCELSFWDIDYQEDGTMEEGKKYISKDAMFKRMVHKLAALLYEQNNE